MGDDLRKPPKPMNLAELRKWREMKENGSVPGGGDDDAPHPGQVEEKEDQSVADLPKSPPPRLPTLSPTAGQKLPGPATTPLQGMRKYNDEVNRLKSKFKRQIHQERSQAVNLVLGLETALETFKTEIAELKALLPNEHGGSKYSMDSRLISGGDGNKRRTTMKNFHNVSSMKHAQQILIAAKLGNLQELKALLEMDSTQPADVCYTDETGMTALLYLLSQITDETVFSDEDEKRLLHRSLSLFVSLGADVNFAGPDSKSALWIACEENEKDLVELLIDTERPEVAEDPIKELSLMANPNQYRYAMRSVGTDNNSSRRSSKGGDSRRTTPSSPKQEEQCITLWHVVLEKDSKELLKLLVKAQCKLEIRCRELLKEEDAKHSTDYEYRRRQRDAERRNRASVSQTSSSSSGQLYYSRNDIKNPSTAGWEAAFANGNPKTWSMQTNAKGNIAWKRDGSPLHVAIACARDVKDALDKLNILVARHTINQDNDAFFTLFDPNAKDATGNTPLHLACRFGYDECIQPLLTYRFHYGDKEGFQVADINLQEDTEKLTPLMCAIKEGHEGVVEELFERNNLVIHGHNSNERRTHDLTIRSKIYNQTALHLACAQKVEMDEVVLLLCKNKAEVNLKDEHGFSPLHLASMFGHIMIVKYLLKYNANAAAMENFGKETPLHIAAAFGHINILNVLLRKGGAEVKTENKLGRTPLHHAFSRHQYLSSLVEYSLSSASEDVLDNPGIADQIANYRNVLARRRERRAKYLGTPNLSPAMVAINSHEPMFEFDHHPQSKLAHTESYQRLGLDLELLFLAINNQNMLIKLLLDAGGDLDHEDKQGDPAFMNPARNEWFDIHEEEMTEIFDHPNEMGYDSAIFTDKRTQVAVRTKWISSGQRTSALKDLLYWIIYLMVLTMVAIRYSGNDSYEAFSMQAGIIDRLVMDEWDEVDLKGLADVGNLDDWHAYLKKVVVTALYEGEQPYVNTSGTQTMNRGALLNGQLALLGRPRYRQIRTLPDSCTSLNPSLLPQTEQTCFKGATSGIFGQPVPGIVDTVSFSCPRKSSEESDENEILEFRYFDDASFPISGRYGYYRGGGFGIVLPSSLEETESLLGDLEDCGFISLNTRAAIVEFTLYSRTQQLFTHGKVFLELTASGGIVGGNKWETRKLVSYSTTQDMYDIIVEVIWLLMVARYIISELVAMRETWGKKHVENENTPMWWFFQFMESVEANRKMNDSPKEFRVIIALPFSRSVCMYKTKIGIPPYWVNVFNYVDVLIMSLIVTLLAVHGTLTFRANRQLGNWYELANTEEYVDISGLLWLAVIRQHLLAAIVLLCYVKSLEYLQVTAALAIPVIIIGGMLRQLMSFFLIFAVFILAFALFDYVLYGLTFEPSSTVLRSIIYTFRGALGDLDFDAKYELDKTIAIFMTCLSAFLLVILLLNLLIAVMNEAFEEIKDSAEARWCYMQFRMIVQHQRKVELPSLDPAHSAGVLKQQLANTVHKVASLPQQPFAYHESSTHPDPNNHPPQENQNQQQQQQPGAVLTPQDSFARWLGERAKLYNNQQVFPE